MKILGGCCRIIGGDTSLSGFAPMVMKRFEIIEKLYLSKALLKMAGEGVHPPHPPLDPPLAIVMLLKRLFASFATAIFRKICRGPPWPKA